MFLKPDWKEAGSSYYWENVVTKKKVSPIKKKKEFPKKVSDFTPYQDNGGTVVALANKGYCVVASDTRFYTGFALPSRNSTRIIKISSSILLATSGMQADLLAFQHKIKENINDYQVKDEKSFSISNCSFFLSSVLYSKRFFPFFTFNLLSGLDEKGEGVNFSFDAIGSFERSQGNCKGKGEQLVQNLLDGQDLINQNEFGKKTQQLSDHVALLKNYFLKAVQRGITLGDGLQVFILTKKGILVENNTLRAD
mmetsp:Transcript_44105/g.88458  ORF Transcript_44105/g.88458 Transcript_44105/m.88458 type:complete len:252 (-) Transcript_44105:895-1650(-)